MSMLMAVRPVTPMVAPGQPLRAGPVDDGGQRVAPRRDVTPLDAEVLRTRSAHP
jgi:hypothetical protein